MESSEWRCFLCMEAYMAISEISASKFWTGRTRSPRLKDIDQGEAIALRYALSLYIKLLEARCFHSDPDPDRRAHPPTPIGLCNMAPSATVLANFFTWNEYSQLLHWPDMKREYDGLS